MREEKLSEKEIGREREAVGSFEKEKKKQLAERDGFKNKKRKEFCRRRKLGREIYSKGKLHNIDIIIIIIIT